MAATMFNCYPDDQNQAMGSILCWDVEQKKVDIDPRSSQLKFGTRLKGCEKVKAAGV